VRAKPGNELAGGLIHRGRISRLLAGTRVKAARLMQAIDRVHPGYLEVPARDAGAHQAKGNPALTGQMREGDADQGDRRVAAHLGQRAVSRVLAPAALVPQGRPVANSAGRARCSTYWDRTRSLTSDSFESESQTGA